MNFHTLQMNTLGKCYDSFSTNDNRSTQCIVVYENSVNVVIICQVNCHYI